MVGLEEWQDLHCQKIQVRWRDPPSAGIQPHQPRSITAELEAEIEPTDGNAGRLKRVSKPGVRNRQADRRVRTVAQREPLRDAMVQLGQVQHMMAKTHCRYLTNEHPETTPDGRRIAAGILTLNLEARGVRHDDFCPDTRQRSLGQASPRRHWGTVRPNKGSPSRWKRQRELRPPLSAPIHDDANFTRHVATGAQSQAISVGFCPTLGRQAWNIRCDGHYITEVDQPNLSVCRVGRGQDFDIGTRGNMQSDME